MTTVFCRECGYKHSDKAKACPKCGAVVGASVSKTSKSDKSIAVYLVLAWFVGFLGVHRFYAGKNGSAVAMLLMGTIGWLLIIPPFISGVWAFVDFIVGLCHISDPDVIFESDK